MNNLEGIVVEVEGNIGSGKSTLLRDLEKWLNNNTHTSVVPQLSWLFAGLLPRQKPPQPVDTRVFFEGGNPDFLEAFCQEMQARNAAASGQSSGDKYTFAFQMHMKTTRLHALDDADRLAHQEGKLVFLDRGAIGDTVFAMLQHAKGNLTEQDMRIYYRQGKPESISSKVDVLLFLYVDPATCHRRMVKRQDPAETAIPVAYLDEIDAGYFEMLMFCLCNQDQEDEAATVHNMPPALLSKYAPANIGRCPKFLALDWSEFGDVEDVVTQLCHLKMGLRRSPNVVFWANCMAPTNIHDSSATAAVFLWDVHHNAIFRSRVMEKLVRGIDIHFTYSS